MIQIDECCEGGAAMGDWQDWNGDGCLSCLLLFIALPVASLGIMIHFLS